MAVPSGICIAWPSTVGSIPAGWSRETTLDARYILGAAAGADTDLTTDRGATTHTHTSPSHTPIQDAHFHTFFEPGGSVSPQILGGALGGNGASNSHGHNEADSNATVGTNNGIAITVNAATNDLAFKEVIWIKSDGTPTALPNGCIAFFESDSLPSGWSRTNGDGYLKGAATGANGGATGGSNTHTHTSPAHTHTQNQHIHTGTSGAPDTAQNLKGTTGLSATSTLGHTHAVTFQGTAPTNQAVTTTINSGNGEPPFKKLNAILASAPDLPTNVIALWLGTNAGIPSGWSRYTAMDSKWAKGAAANGESGVTTGGSSQHNHTASDCQPIQDAHTHSITDAASSASIVLKDSTSAFWPDVSHQHGGWLDLGAVATNQAIAVTIDQCTADAALPKHRTVIYVQFTGVTPPSVGGVYTSYTLGLFDLGSPQDEILPEAAKKIAQGDLRFVPNR
jgi:hypothetical protein